MARSAKHRIWVPGEACDGGIIVTDADSGEEVHVLGVRIGTLELPTRSGGVHSHPAVRADLVGTEGKYALARLPNGATIRTKILFGWQLTEDGTRPVTEFTPSERGAKLQESGV
jgi:hypothetical protein